MRALAVLALGLLAACGDGLSDAEKQAKDEADVAFIENLEPKNPPPEPIDPQPIGYPDIEQHQIYGASCAFAPGDGIGAVLIAEDQSAWLKLEGRMLRLASDPGSAKNPFGTWAHYDGKEYSARIEIDQATAEQAGDEVVDYSGKLAIEDPFGQLVYSASGTVQCGA